MATTTIETVIANPARKKGKGMTAKQIKYFGSKRQKAALKAKRKAAAKKAHRKRTKPNPPRKKRTATPAAPKKRRKRPTGSAKRRKAKAKRKNPGAIYAVVNPARKGHKKVARSRKTKRQRKNPAGFSFTRKKKPHRTRRHNPGAFGKPMDWLSLGGGAIIGGLGATSLPQMVLGASNTGAIGYLGMAASTALLAVASHMVLKRNTMAVAGIIAGGAGALIKRVLSDYTPIGSYLSGAGMGDYLANFNFSTPQIIGGNGNTSLGAPGSIPVSVAGAGVRGGSLIGAPLY